MRYVNTNLIQITTTVAIDVGVVWISSDSTLVLIYQSNRLTLPMLLSQPLLMQLSKLVDIGSVSPFGVSQHHQNLKTTFTGQYTRTQTTFYTQLDTSFISGAITV